MPKLNSKVTVRTLWVERHTRHSDYRIGRNVLEDGHVEPDTYLCSDDVEMLLGFPEDRAFAPFQVKIMFENPQATRETTQEKGD